MTIDEVIETLSTFAQDRKGGCTACPKYNECGKIGCEMAGVASELLYQFSTEFTEDDE